MTDERELPERKIHVPDEVWTAAVSAAEANGESINDVVRAALRDYVAQEGEQPTS